MKIDRLSFSRSLYRLDAIEATVQAYAGLGTWSVDSSPGNEVVVSVTDPHPSYADQLLDAFSNHVLFETIRRSRAEQGGEV